MFCAFIYIVLYICESIQEQVLAMFGRKERKVKRKKNLKEKKIFFLYVIWYVENKEN